MVFSGPAFSLLFYHGKCLITEETQPTQIRKLWALFRCPIMKLTHQEVMWALSPICFPTPVPSSTTALHYSITRTDKPPCLIMASHASLCHSLAPAVLYSPGPRKKNPEGNKCLLTSWLPLSQSKVEETPINLRASSANPSNS